jgi:rhamnulokinase
MHFMKTCLAIDVGASGGRHILGRRGENGGVVLEEVYRFDNGAVRRGDMLCWDTDALFGHILAGMKHCAEIGKIPASIGICTWGVDFVLLGQSGEPLGEAVSYRDARTAGMESAVHEILPEPEHYARTGTRRYIFNTIYQLMALKTRTPELLRQAKTLLFMPDYLHYKLSGVMACETSIAATSGLLNASDKDWDDEVIARCGYPRGIFQPLKQPGTVLGRMSKTVRDEVGFDCEIVLPHSHDTASAFYSVPMDDHIILNSGTWSIMGIKSPVPVTTEEARASGFTNEGNRLVKNIAGLWMIQSIREELPGLPDYDSLMQLARESDYKGYVDVDDSTFYAPESMSKAITAKCRENGFAPPLTPGDTLRCVYQSLARVYADTAGSLIKLTGRQYKGIYIIGGGNKAALLNEMTAQTCGLPTLIGPAEGTAEGNILCQLKQWEEQ